ncbi:hypothetical protein [Plantactinospora sp. GCM10030261]|uniref:hypothetical protein n=1 Tax=Plantactinospora sp. GCM10030261 TaxID=3273420 RepID=UPI003623FFDC
MGTHDAYAMAHILAAYRKIGVEPSVMSVQSLPDGLDNHLTCIGGHAVNRLTRAHLTLFCPRFVPFETSQEATGPRTGYRCGSDDFVDSEDRAWGFLVKLGPKLTGRLTSTILVWGLGPLGTSAAGYVLSDLHRRLPAENQDSYFIAIPVQTVIGYRGVSSDFLDLTTRVWPPPTSASI